MRFIVHLYKEGDPMDGDTFAVGPYSDEGQADSDAALLAQFGTVLVMTLFDTADDLISVL